MSRKLTEGALARICAQQGEVQNAIVQVLGYKSINHGSGQERFRLLLSDGMYSNSFCMLATQHNERIHSKELEMFTILKLTRVLCNRSSENSSVNLRVIVVLEFDVVASGAEVGYKIGSPWPLMAELNRPTGPVGGQLPTETSPDSYQPQQRSVKEQDDIEKIEAVEASFRVASKFKENQIQAEIAGTEKHLKETQNTLDKLKQQLEEHKARSGAELAEIQKKKEDLKTMMRERGNDNDNDFLGYIIGNFVPECPVCYERMSPPMQIFTCGNGHVICSVCKEKVEETRNMCIYRCGAVYAGRATAMEQMIRQIFGNM